MDVNANKEKIHNKLTTDADIAKELNELVEFNELVSSLEYDITVHTRTMEYAPFLFCDDLFAGHHALRSFIDENPGVEKLVTEKVQKLFDTAEKIELDYANYYHTWKNKYIKERAKENNGHQ